MCAGSQVNKQCGKRWQAGVSGQSQVSGTQGFQSGGTLWNGRWGENECEKECEHPFSVMVSVVTVTQEKRPWRCCEWFCAVKFSAKEWQKSPAGSSSNSWGVNKELNADHHPPDGAGIHSVLSAWILCALLLSPSPSFDPKQKPDQCCSKCLHLRKCCFFSQAHERGKSQVQNRAMHLILTVAVPSCLCFPWKALRLQHRTHTHVLLFTFVKL